MSEDSDTIKKIMNSPIGIESGATLDVALNNLLTHKISRLFVFKDKKAIGIVSEKDILNYFYRDKLKARTNEIQIDDIMHEVYVNDLSTSIPEAAKFMIEYHCSSTGVGSKEDLKGIVTKTDLTKYFAENFFGKKIVKDQLAIDYFSAFIKDGIYDVVGKMLGSEFSRMVVVYNERKPVGIISTGDVFRTILDIEATEKTERILNLTQDFNNIWLRYKEFCSYPAEKVMSRGVLNIGENEDLAKACQMILDKGINALGVQNPEGEIIGIIGKREILMALATMP